MSVRSVLVAIALSAPFFVMGQASAPAVAAVATDFPARAEPLDEAALTARLAGKVFRMQFAAGASLRLDIRSNGYVYGDASTGWRDTGRWQVKGSAWCDDWNRTQAASGCNEVRLADGVLLLKRRTNGEIVVLRE